MICFIYDFTTFYCLWKQTHPDVWWWSEWQFWGWGGGQCCTIWTMAESEVGRSSFSTLFKCFTHYKSWFCFQIWSCYYSFLCPGTDSSIWHWFLWRKVFQFWTFQFKKGLQEARKPRFHSIQANYSIINVLFLVHVHFDKRWCLCPNPCSFIPSSSSLHPSLWPHKYRSWLNEAPGHDPQI